MNIKNSLLIIQLLVFTCCSKVAVEEPEPNHQNFPPGIFEVSIDGITDREVTLSWSVATDPEKDPFTYEVAVNDSVVAFDLDVNAFTISQLIPDNTYKISVIAIDNNLNNQAVSKTVRTAKSFIHSIYSYQEGIDKYGFTSALLTSDGGFLIYGYTSRTGEDRSIAILKLSSDYSIQWTKEFAPSGDNGYPNQMIECSDHNYLIVREKTVLKIDQTGNTIWSFRAQITARWALRVLSKTLMGSYSLPEIITVNQEIIPASIL